MKYQEITHESVVWNEERNFNIPSLFDHLNPAGLVMILGLSLHLYVRPLQALGEHGVFC